MSDAASFGAWLKQRRTTCDLTQAALAQRLGCSTETISKLERGERHPSRALSERLAAVLNLAPDERAEFLRLARMAPPTNRQPVPSTTRQYAVAHGTAPPVPASPPIVATKLYRPRLRAELVARPRLLARYGSLASSLILGAAAAPCC